MCKGACHTVRDPQTAPPFIYYVWNQTQTPNLYPLHVGEICTWMRDLMFWSCPCTKALAPVQHCNAKHCSDMNPNFTAWENPNFKINLMTENLHKSRKWAAEIYTNIAYRGPEPAHLETMKFFRSASKVFCYNLMTLYNNEINTSLVYFHQNKRKKKKTLRQE